MARQHKAAVAVRSESGEQVGLLPRHVIGAAATSACFLQQRLGIVDQREIGIAAGRVERDQLPYKIKRGGRHLAQPCSRLAGLPMMFRNSRLVSELSRKAPSMVEVTMVTPVLCTPRVVM